MLAPAPLLASSSAGEPPHGPSHHPVLRYLQEPKAELLEEP